MKETVGSSRLRSFFSDKRATYNTNTTRQILIHVWGKSHNPNTYSVMVADIQEYYELKVTGKMSIEDFTKYFSLFITAVLCDPNDIDTLVETLSSDEIQK